MTRASVRARLLLLILLFTILPTAAASCRRSPEANRVRAVYDKETGKLVQLAVDARKDGKPDIFSYMDGTRFVRIEIDADEDGKIDRWEYYGAGRKIEKVGTSSSNTGMPDRWAYPDAAGTIARVETASRPGSPPDRTEFFESGELRRAEADSDGDGRTDKWEVYEDSALVSVSFDVGRTGKPTHTINYRQASPK